MAGGMITARHHTATLLNDGTVVFAVGDIRASRAATMTLLKQRPRLRFDQRTSVLHQQQRLQPSCPRPK